jgi:hypothetical protein
MPDAGLVGRNLSAGLVSVTFATLCVTHVLTHRCYLCFEPGGPTSVASGFDLQAILDSGCHRRGSDAEGIPAISRMVEGAWRLIPPVLSKNSADPGGVAATTTLPIGRHVMSPEARLNGAGDPRLLYPPVNHPASQVFKSSVSPSASPPSHRSGHPWIMHGFERALLFIPSYSLADPDADAAGFFDGVAALFHRV